MTSSDGERDRLKYLTNGELREEIVYTVGGDPSRYRGEPAVFLCKADLRRVAVRLQPTGSGLEVDVMGFVALSGVVHRWAGCEHDSSKGASRGLNRECLKAVHRSLDARSPREVVSP